MIENHSLYYLHPLEGLGVLITALIFDGKDYDLWEQVVRTTLKAKNKLMVIGRELPKPTPKEGEDMTKLQQWEMVNSITCSWILNIIEPKLRTNVAFVETVQLIWENLKKRYVIANAPKIQLKVSLIQCKQGGMDAVDYYARSMELWSEVENQVR